MNVLPGATYASRLALGPTKSGLAGTVRHWLLDNDGSPDDPVYGPSPASIIEDPTGSGSYVFAGPAPQLEGDYTPAWDEGEGTPLLYDDDLIVTSSPAAGVPPDAPYTERLALGPAQSGLAGTVRYRLLDNDLVADDPVTAPTTAGIIEDPAGSGSYLFTGTSPADADVYSPAWDTGDGTPLLLGGYLVVTSAASLPLADVLPTVADVANLLRARTTDTLGNELGTFTAATRPTDAQVTQLIATAATLISTSIGDHVPPDLTAAARALIQLRTAMLVELSYYPEQAREQLSTFSELKALAKEALAALKEARLNLGGDIEYAVDCIY